MARQNPCCKKCLKYSDNTGDCIGVEEYSSEFQGQMFCFIKKTGSKKGDLIKYKKMEINNARRTQKSAQVAEARLMDELATIRKS